VIRHPKTHSRLIGTWKTNIAETKAFWKFPKGARNQSKLFAEIFGARNLQLTFTANNMIWKDDDGEQRYRYRVLATDQNSVVIAVRNEGDELLVQYSFDPDGTAMSVASFLGGNIEFFQKVDG
jgi:hypothetical protein